MGSQHSEIGVATSKSLAPGTWTDHGSIGLPQNEQYNLIDPHAFQDREQDPVYFTFGSYWTGIQQFIVQDHSQLIAIAGDLPQVNNIISNTTEHYAVQEGATMHKHGRDFYIFFSVGQCCRTRAELMPPGDEYHIVVCRAETVNGPYFDKERKNCGTENGGTTILASHGDIYAPGGQGVIMDEDTKKDVLYYHYGKLCSSTWTICDGVNHMQ